MMSQLLLTTGKTASKKRLHQKNVLEAGTDVTASTAALHQVVGESFEGVAA
jgi:hypothetical protein